MHAVTGLQQESLEYQIKVDIDQIRREFAKLQTVIRQSLKKNSVTAKEVVTHVFGYVVSEADKEKLNKAEQSLEDVFKLLTGYWSFLDCDLLDSIVEVYGSDEDRKRMVEYQKKLQDFCERRVISEIPRETQIHVCNQMTMSVKLNMSDPRLCEIKEIKSKVCKILKVDPATLVIKEIKKGCVKVTYFILESVLELLKRPLTEEQREAFRAASILSLSCDHFQETFTVSLSLFLQNINIKMLIGDGTH